MPIKIIDCTLRDGGYYTNWDFSISLIEAYLTAMSAVGVDFVELGFRSLEATAFKGACAYTTDGFIRRLSVPSGLDLGVMVNAAEFHRYNADPVEVAEKLFVPAVQSPVSIVRIACHVHEFADTLPVCNWLSQLGYRVGINLMQIADRSDSEIIELAEMASKSLIDVLYFADSFGSLNAEQTTHIVHTMCRHWGGEVGIHAHDNIGRALSNTSRAVAEGATWVDCTVTGMGRGPGNTKTENVLIEFEDDRFNIRHQAALLKLIEQYFKPLHDQYGWGTNPYYYLSGKYGIHPSYVQEMLGDPRYDESEMLSVIEHLRKVGGKKFCAKLLEEGRHVYDVESEGTWDPVDLMANREVLILGPGPSVSAHREGLEDFIREYRPIVVALNIQRSIDDDLIDVRAACHPFRMVADSASYHELKQPLVLPKSQVPKMVKNAIRGITSFDFGLCVTPDTFAFHRYAVVAPSSLVIAYVLAMVTSGKASQILLAGIDGYNVGDPRFSEMEKILSCYQQTSEALQIESITPTKYKIPTTSLYAIR